MEELDFYGKFGKYRLRKTVREAKDLRALLEEYIAESSKERRMGHMTNKDRIDDLEAFAEEIEAKIANEVANMRGSELLALQELLTDIARHINRLNNKMNSGLKSAMTKKIQQLEENITETVDEDEEYYLIESHPFSTNYMYEYNLAAGMMLKSPSYQRWINNLHLENYLPETYPGVDFTQPLKVTLLYGHKNGMDTTNFSKSILDQVASYYGFNDGLVRDCRDVLDSYVASYNEGYIYIKIENL